MTPPRLFALAWAATAALVLAACAPPAGQGPGSMGGPAEGSASESTVTHVHALDVDEASGVVSIATHYGIYAAELTDDGSARVARIGDWQGDAMGMARVGGELLLSGHPAADEAGPPNLGVVWFGADGSTEVIALDGEVDFHAMAAHGDRVAGWDSATGAVFVSDDAGLSWSTGSVHAIRSLAWAPDGATLISTTADGLLASTDDGVTFALVAGAPSLVLIAANDATAEVPRVAGIDVNGVVHVSSDGRSWQSVSEAPFLPEAIAVASSGRVAIADTTTALISAVDGLSWRTLFAY